MTSSREPGRALEPTTAERLSRLRQLLAKAQNRAGDTSVLGHHLALIALDGVAELALGLCLHQRSLTDPGSVPGMVTMLRNDLGDRWAGAGLQGFNEVHRARNLAQHQGILPAPDQLPRWAAEIEIFVRDLISTVFGVDLQTASSALGVADPKLRELLHRAERALDEGDFRTSFDLAWEALDAARAAWRGSARGSTRLPSSGSFTRFNEFSQIRAAIAELNDRLEIGTFTSEISEWVWMREQHAESATRSPPTLDDARRALVFVTGWVLRFESYSARYPAERWREWREKQVAPRTGIPGDGPRILDAELEQRDANHPDKAHWRFQLADLPTSDDDFSSAVSGASLESEQEEPRVTMHLGLRGQLSVAAPVDLPPEQLLSLVRGKLRRAREIVVERERQDAQFLAQAEDLAAPYREAFAAAAAQGAPFGDVVVVLRNERHASPGATVVSVALVGDEVGEVDYWNALSEVMQELGLDPAGQGFTAFSTLNFPISWPPDRAVEWAIKGFERARQRRAESKAVQAEDEQRRQEAVVRMRELLGDQVM